MKKIPWTSMALLLMLMGCAAPTIDSEPTASLKYGVYEFSFSVEQLSGENTDQWEFVYTYDGETIDNGHQLRYSLELFTFYYIQVEIVEKGIPSNKYTARFPVAICDGGIGKTEMTVTDTSGKSATFKIICRVTQIGKQ